VVKSVAKQVRTSPFGVAGGIKTSYNGEREDKRLWELVQTLIWFGKDEEEGGKGNDAGRAPWMLSSC